MDPEHRREIARLGSEAEPNVERRPRASRVGKTSPWHDEDYGTRGLRRAGSRGTHGRSEWEGQQQEKGSRTAFGGRGFGRSARGDDEERERGARSPSGASDVERSRGAYGASGSSSSDSRSVRGRERDEDVEDRIGGSSRSRGARRTSRSQSDE